MVEFTAQTIATHLNGTVEGNAGIKITAAARIEQGKPGTLCFLANPKYEKYLYSTKASIVLINKDYELKAPVQATLIRVDNAYSGITAVLTLLESAKNMSRKGREWPSRVSWFSKRGKNCYIGAFACISRGVHLGKNVKVFPHVYIGENVVVGDNTILYPGVKIYAGCLIGANCILHAGVVIGADGFGFAPQADKTYSKIPQTGNVVIEDDVEIGANTTIDRATMGSTIIRQGAKLDNLIQIAHNVEIGKNTVMAALVGVAGSSKIGENCMIGGQVGFAGHLHIGNHVRIGAQAGVTNNIEDNKVVQGSPAMDYTKFMRSSAVFRNLPELRNDVNSLKKKIAEENNSK